MTLVVDILARAARQCSVTPPSSWASATDQTSLEVLDFLAETVDDAQERIDLAQPLSKTVTITGTGVENYALPADCKRLHRGEFGVYERQNTRRPCVSVSDDGQWEYMKELGSAGAYRFYRLRGYDGARSIDLYQPLEASSTIVIGYVSRNWIVGDKAAFTSNDDVSMFDRRLLEAGIVFRFRERKGLEYADKHAEYEALLARMANDTRARRKVTFGGVGVRGVFDVPVPDYIPAGP